jgi:hypothetical protein
MQINCALVTRIRGGFWAPSSLVLSSDSPQDRVRVAALPGVSSGSAGLILIPLLVINSVILTTSHYFVL